MDPSKWRVKKSIWGDWDIYSPGYFLPGYIEVRTRTFEEAIRLLPILQHENYMRSRRWRDG
ncbi:MULTISPECIES: hypothetical protein [unclassified Streptomyces]|uniref:hypothetical protein n=1 Tax=unclassified Streptomyces TaxID=2593676 RepID=UPI000A6DB7CA|nr:MULTISPECIES: hypothetical protein [unclassified Streptomyces]